MMVVVVSAAMIVIRIDANEIDDAEPNTALGHDGVGKRANLTRRAPEDHRLK